MSETTNEDRMYPIEMTLQGARCCISIGKGVIKALGKPSHVSIKISDSHDSLSVFPCDEDDVMAFRVPLKLFTDHRCVMKSCGQTRWTLQRHMFYPASFWKRRIQQYSR